MSENKKFRWPIAGTRHLALIISYFSFKFLKCRFYTKITRYLTVDTHMLLIFFSFSGGTEKLLHSSIGSTLVPKPPVGPEIRTRCYSLMGSSVCLTRPFYTHRISGRFRLVLQPGSKALSSV